MSSAGFCDLPIGVLVKASWNYKADDDVILEKLTENMRRNGQIENIIVRELGGGQYEIVNGNHRLDAMRTLGMKTVKCYNLGSISEAQAKRIAVETNETRFPSNDDSLNNLLLELTTEFDIDDLIETLPFDYDDDFDFDEDESIGIEEQEVPEPAVAQPANTKSGDLYEINGHRLLCGDSTLPETYGKLFGEDVASLIVTDPPYGINYAKKNKLLNQKEKFLTGKYGTRLETEIAQDGNDIDYLEFFSDALRHVPLADYNSIYVFITRQHLHNLRLAFDNIGYKFSAYLIWLKNHIVLGWMDYNFKTEFLLYGWKGRHKFYGGKNETNIFEYDHPSSSRLHPKMKPTPLLEHLMRNNSAKGDIVFDGFLGSGSTMVAADNMQRRCFGVELDPHYCDVSVKRVVDSVRNRGEDVVVTKNGIDITHDGWLS